MKYRRMSDIALLFNELAILLESGVDLSEALQIIQAEPDPALNHIVNRLHKATSNGAPLSEALAQQPEKFDQFIVNIIQRAEQKNQLTSVLYEVATFLENDLNERELTKQMGLSLTYVVFLLGIALVVTAGLLTYVVPVFDDLFSSFGAELPAMTQFFIALGNYSAIVLLVLLALIGFSIVAWYRIAFNLPLLGKLYHLTAISHFLHTAGFILQQGGTMQEALEQSGISMGYNRRYSHALVNASQQLGTGKSTAELLKATNLFPQKVIHALHVGEKRSNLGLLLQQLAEVYRLKVNQSFEPRLRLFSFILLILVGCFIGLLVIAMYLPIFQMGAVI